MKYIVCLFTLTFFSIVSGCHLSGRSLAGNDPVRQRPNIIFIMVDDMGWKDVGFMGSSYYETPNIDQLARQGMQFSNSYAAAANCAPSRACFISGQNTPRHGMYTVGEPDRGHPATRKLIPSKNNKHLPEDVYTFAEVFQASGYHTSIFGKWHIGADARTQGFDFKVGGNGKGLNKYFPPYENSGIEDGPAGEYLTDRLTSEAIKVLEQQKDKQFFLYLPYFAVHTPLEAPAGLIEKYKRKVINSAQNNPVYAAMIESLDFNIGRLLKRVDELDLSQNTIVVFTSDNGGIRAISDQAPLRAGKGSYYEGGIRVPMIVRWPGKVAAGSRSDEPVTNMDFYPTFLDILNEKSKTPHLDGESILPVLQGKSMSERPLYWHFPIYLQAYDKKLDDARDPLYRTRPGSVIRLGDWKLHEYFEDGKLELYNLKNDVGERNNVMAKHPEITAKLHKMLVDWRKETNAPVPIQINPEYDPTIKLNDERKLRIEN